jgi:hypothetical protein
MELQKLFDYSDSVCCAVENIAGVKTLNDEITDIKPYFLFIDYDLQNTNCSELNLNIIEKSYHTVNQFQITYILPSFDDIIYAKLNNDYATKHYFKYTITKFSIKPFINLYCSKVLDDYFNYSIKLLTYSYYIFIFIFFQLNVNLLKYYYKQITKNTR